MKSIQLRYSILLLIYIFLASCFAKKDQKNNKLKVLHYNQHRGVSSLDPAFARSQANIWAVDHLFNGLVQLDEELNVQPAIAKSWDISEDGKAYTFHLRNDVYFHKNECFADSIGRKCTAVDFEYSFNRIISEEVSSPGSWIFKGKVDTIQPFKAINDSTFQLRLLEPFRPMLGILTMQYCCVVPKEAVDFYGKNFRANPVGTGPFKFKKWLENQSMFLIKNQNYFESLNGEQLPFLDGVRISFIADRKTAYLELMNGKLDLISGLESSYVNELLTSDGDLQPSQAKRLQFLKSPYLNTEYLGINMKFKDNISPLKKRKVRQALNFGFDRGQMLAALRNNVGKPANKGFVPKGLPAHNFSSFKGYHYNPNKALELLNEAGFPNGEGMPEIVLMTNKDYLDLCTFITRQWEDIGIKSKIELVESATLRSMMRKSQAPFFRGSWIADYPDGESFLTVFYGKNPAPPNYTHFRNSQFDLLYEQALKENVDSIRYDLYNKMDQILVEEAPVVFLFYDETAVFATKNISGLSRNAINLLSLKAVKKE